MPDVYLHVGLPKTGTKFLQELCFPNLKGVHFERSRLRVSPTGIIELLWRVADTYPLFSDIEEHRAEVGRFLHEVAADKLLISSERLFGDVLLGYRDNPLITESLQRLFPTGKIILTIRRQDEFLESLYRELVRGYLYPTVDGFLGYVDRSFTNSTRPVLASVRVARLDYHTYVRNYAAAFGRDNVLVLPLEMLRADPQRYHAKLATFIGVEPYHPPENTSKNRSYSMLSCRVALLLNRFVRSPQWENRPWRVIPHEPLTPYLRGRTSHDLPYRLLDALNRRLSLRYVLNNIDRLHLPQGKFINDEKRQLIMKVHRESNRRLDEEYALDLQKYGYY